jgi:hypothetical protein
LYRAGLWLTVIIAPATWRLPLAKYSMSLEPRPPMIPHPRPGRSRRGRRRREQRRRGPHVVHGDDRPGPGDLDERGLDGFRRGVVQLVGTMPRMSYALKIFA